MANKIQQSIKMPELDKNGKAAVLKLYTTKGSRGLYSNASVNFIEGHFETHMMFSDFNETIATSNARATQKAIDVLHEKSFNVQAIETIKQQARDHYKAKN